MIWIGGNEQDNFVAVLIPIDLEPININTKFFSLKMREKRLYAKEIFLN